MPNTAALDSNVFCCYNCPKAGVLKQSNIRSNEAKNMPTLPIYQLKLWTTYYNQGFFNVPVAFDQFVRPDEGPVTLALDGVGEVQAQVNRSANNNGTARIMGRPALRDWFQSRYEVEDLVPLRFDGPRRMTLG